MFSHPVRLFKKGDIPSRPDMTSVRWLRSGGESGSGASQESETWVDFGTGSRLLNLGFADPLLICSESLAEKKYFFLGFGFATQGFPVGSERTLMEMVGRSDEIESTVRGQVTVANYSFYMDSKKRTHEEAFPPGTVSLVLSYSADGVHYTEVARSTAYIPSIAAADRPRIHSTLSVEAGVPAGSSLKLSLVFNRRSKAHGVNQLRLLDARMFGTVCVPDFSTPGSCL